MQLERKARRGSASAAAYVDLVWIALVAIRNNISAAVSQEDESIGPGFHIRHVDVLSIIHRGRQRDASGS